MNNARPWLENPYFDAETRREVQALWNDPIQLENAFFADLKFGTGGLRGTMGVGTYRMNIYTVRKATQGLASYLLKTGLASRGVVIGFDSRHNSKLFAQETARVLMGNNIPVYLCREIRPTPFISFACRHLQAAAAVMITASHNPKEYNGYKVFWDDGAQIVSPHDQGITAEIEAISSYTDVCLADLDHPLLRPVDSFVDRAYLEAICSLPIFSKTPQQDLQICYSSLHGTGITLLPLALEKCGFVSPLLVERQCTPDGSFPTVASPNPESPSALKEGIELLKESQSDLLLVTDPDADRLGVVINHEGTPYPLNGHELATLGTYYLCETLSKNKKLPKKSAIVTTIVTTPLLDRMTKAYKVKTTRVLTGFKYIGEKIREWDLSKQFSFLFGAEESFGYLIGTYCRDKDGISAACLFAQIASDLKAQGKTCLDLLHEIYTRFGVYQEKALSLTFSDGKEGVETVQYLMQTLRETPPALLGDQTIVRKVDYLQEIKSLPRADVLQWVLEDGTSLIIRPSGTEPKLKVYLSTHRPSKADVSLTISECRTILDQQINLLNQYFTHVLEKQSQPR